MKQLLSDHDYPVRRVCAALEVSPSGYYEWLARPASARTQHDQRLQVSIGAIHQASRHSYGTRRVHRQLQAHTSTFQMT
ncbi:hypothetical protein [Sphaerotilus microaerophilus]|uniref:Transposase n=1 Tax=Sphaerotilus microaerophilus TaxID=2914710 RepID=A0ABM7YPV6_9BURK|nr:hypothetical protein [Sphaerotilus sp. FB-5]BDI06567.1 hypothetical protein CATMQ487_35370 [Sphaerotilus sp. FB-5]